MMEVLLVIGLILCLPFIIRTFTKIDTRSEEAYRRGYLNALTKVDMWFRVSINSSTHRGPAKLYYKVMSKVLEESRYPITTEDKEPIYKWVDAAKDMLDGKADDDDE